MIKKKIIYIDMDLTLCDYVKSYEEYKSKYPDKYPQSHVGFFIGLAPLPGAIDSYLWLDKQDIFDVYILTAPSIHNSHCYSEKRDWVEKHLGFDKLNKLIISPNKGLNIGDYLIDDSLTGRGQENFKGIHIHFGCKDFPDWDSVIKYFKEKYKL